ncbi:retinoid-inducible serine carboxypeptidase-like [Pecten maximus]|uniref:retinoid-inducible serine carboxypeptidase-like n=1 Tax=Pecten maximus TaxID=6579 RepID=UPI0014590408|nr:retinoid-inducible serine carboxypeptidase-like [Pecten maximus]
MSPYLLFEGLSIWLACFCITLPVLASHGQEMEPTQHWAYVDVRDKAHMFYWLYESPKSGSDVPLVMWLQGGPGGSSTGFGNFEEIGPLDVDLKSRNTTWLSVTSLLFVDNPVGTGFSFVDTPDALTTDVDMIAGDMLVLLKSFFMESKWGIKYQKSPFYIFCESYGGKMTAAISNVLYQAIQSKELQCNFKGLALGDSWISPIDSMLNWGTYLHTNSIVDKQGMSLINASAYKALEYIQSDQWTKATDQFNICEGVVEENSNGVNFYNILKWGSEKSRDGSLVQRRYNGEGKKTSPSYGRTQNIESFTNRQIDSLDEWSYQKKAKDHSFIQVQWGGQSEEVFQYMKADFMRPVVDIVNRLIKETNLHVVVYTGQLDLICCTPGTEKWVETLDIYPEFFTSKRTAISDPVTGLTSGFVKTYKNFAMYWILGAGHMAPQDNGNTVLTMVKRVTASHVHNSPKIPNLASSILHWIKRLSPMI